MNIYIKYLRTVKSVKGLIILDQLYKRLFWVAFICSCLYYVFSLSKELMWHLVIITVGISIIWIIVKILRLYKIGRLSDICDLGLENQKFRKNTVDMYRKRLNRIGNKLQKNSSDNSEREKQNLLFCIETCVLYDSKNTNYEQYKFIPYSVEILRENILCIIEYSIDKCYAIGKIIKVDKEDDWVTVCYLYKSNEFIEKHFYDLHTGIRHETCKIIAIEKI